MEVKKLSKATNVSAVFVIATFVATQVGFGQNVSMSINPGIVGLVGLPEHNVLLAGQPSAPILVNTTDRAIIAYTVRWANSSGPSFSEINVSFLHIRAGQPPVIPARSQRAVDRDTNLVDRDGRPSGPPLAVILDAVIFEDGELVGPDLTHTFDMVSTRVKAEQDIHQKLLRAGNTAADRAAVWHDIGRAAQKSRATTRLIPAIPGCSGLMLTNCYEFETRKVRPPQSS